MSSKNLSSAQSLRKFMIDPVTLVESGFTYERAALKTALKRRPRVDPLTNAPLKSQKIVPNRALKSAIEVFNNVTQPLQLSSTCLICRAPIDSKTLEENGICQSCQNSIIENDPELFESSDKTCLICSTRTSGSDFCPSCEEVAEEAEMVTDMIDDTLTKRFQTPCPCRSLDKVGVETPSTTAPPWTERL